MTNILQALERARSAQQAGAVNRDKREVERPLSSTQFDLTHGGYSRTQGDPVPALASWRDAIPDADLAGNGRERNLHITVKFGLHTADPEAVRRVVQGFGPVTVMLGDVSIFPGAEHDVVKVDVLGVDIRRLNHLISRSLDCTDTHPTYKPHVTIAYVRPGAGRKYVGRSPVNNCQLTFDRLTFSDADGQQTVLSLLDVNRTKREVERPQHYAFDASQHPRGQPENKGEFVAKGQSAAGGKAPVIDAKRLGEFASTPLEQRVARHLGFMNTLPADALKQTYLHKVLQKTSDTPGAPVTVADIVQALQGLDAAVRSGQPVASPEAPTPSVAPKQLAPKKNTVSVEKGFDASPVLKKLFPEHAGDIIAAQNKLAAVLGAPDGSTVIISNTDPAEFGGVTGVKVLMYNDTYTASRFIGFDGKGKKYIYNNVITIGKKENQGKGLGTEIFSKQVENAAANGFSYIACDAAGKPGDKHFNGYYTWPLLGYDAPLSVYDENYSKCKKQFPQAKTVADVMAAPEGRKWWKENGAALSDARFDLTPGSRSRRTLDSYLQDREQRKAGK